MGVGGKPIRYPKPSPRGLVRILTAVAALSCCSSAIAAGSDEPRRVVVIYPLDSDGAPGIILVNTAIRSTFAEQPLGRFEVCNEYVDTSRLRDAEFMEAQIALMRLKYAGRRVELLIAGLSTWLDFALAIRGKVFPGVPVVHTLVDEGEVKGRRLPTDVTGVPIRMGLTGTLDLAMRLHPRARRVYVIAGCSPFDSAWEARARQLFRPFEARLEFVYLTGLPLADLLDRVADLPEQSVIYYLHVFKDGTGQSFVPAEVLERLAERANAPIYSHVDTFVDRGAIGGHAYTHEAEGRTAARLGLRVLAGEAADTIPVPEENENTYLFDWRQMRRWGISEYVLPPGSVVRHKEPTVWDSYKWHILGGLTLCLVEGLLIAGLLVQLVKRRRADERLRLVIETAPTGILMVGQDGRIVSIASNRPCAISAMR
ncbi:MAG: ABC transporter substrate binding protein [Gemmataceae bacterium]